MEDNKASKITKDPPIIIKLPRQLIFPDNNPIAVCSNNFRYHKNNGNGALKYDPVTCSKILNANACEALRYRRGSNGVKMIIDEIFAPGCTEFKHKIMVVPSIGCPSELSVEAFVKKLLWACYAENRPTVLLIHSSEMETYKLYLEVVLKKLKVGLVSWSCDKRVGFGLSRLAAQQYAMTTNQQRKRVVLCDVNVTAFNFQYTKQLTNEKIKKGYDTDEQSDSDIEGKAEFETGKGRKRHLLYGAGFASGIPTYEYDNNKSKFKRIKMDKGGSSRPIEQVVTVRQELGEYDPCFIMSSEDSDLTKALLDKQDAPEKLENFKFKDSVIEKVAFQEGSNRCNKYIEKREEYLNSLADEDKFYIQYNANKKSNITTIGKLAEEIADQHGKKKMEIRSLIIEKILLKHKHNR